MRELADAERAPLREAFLAKYPTAFWVDFPDFKQVPLGGWSGLLWACGGLECAWLCGAAGMRAQCAARVLHARAGGW